MILMHNVAYLPKIMRQKIKWLSMNLNLLQSIEAGIRESEAIFLESEVQELSVIILK